MQDDLITYIGTMASVVSLLVALFQTIRVRNLQIERQRRLWTQIASNKAMMRHLERQDVNQAYGLVCEQFRDLLREASILENEFSPETIRLWRYVGKLSSDWQERQALMLLPTPAIERLLTKNQELPKMEQEVSHFDDPPPDHPIAKLKSGGNRE